MEHAAADAKILGDVDLGCSDDRLRFSLEEFQQAPDAFAIKFRVDIVDKKERILVTGRKIEGDI